MTMRKALLFTCAAALLAGTACAPIEP